MWRPRLLSRPATRTESVPEPDNAGVPGWVTQFRRWGVPAAAILVLGLCAPGERYLADLVGWTDRMSWGLAGLFTLYAGLAAVISTQLPKGARGKGSSIGGAVISLALAMGAQPVAHMFATGYLTAEPRPPLWLVISVSSVPPLVLGHLLHFAAMPPAVRPVVRPDTGQDTTQIPVATVTRLRPRPVPSPVPAAVPPVSRPAVRPPVPVLSLSKGQTSGQSTGQPTGQLAPKLNMSVRALELAQAGQDKDTIKDMLRKEFTGPDGTPPKPDSVRKAADRAVDKVSAQP